MEALPPRGSWRVWRGAPRPEKPRVFGLLEPDSDAIPVRISVQQDGFITGWDDGALGFDGDAVWFSGRDCSFRVFAPDLWRFAYRPDDLERFTPSTLLRRGIPLRHPSREVRIRVDVLPIAGRRDWEDRSRVAFEIRRLLFLEGSSGKSQYPPLSPRPGAEMVEASQWDSLSGVIHVLEGDPLERLFKAVSKSRRMGALLEAIATEEGEH